VDLCRREESGGMYSTPLHVIILKKFLFNP